jgi:hypothetical protein
MKQVLIVAFMVSMLMMGGCAGVANVKPTIPPPGLQGGEGASKQGINMGESVAFKEGPPPGGLMGGEGASKPGTHMGESPAFKEGPPPGGLMGGEGALKPGIQWPQPK